MRISKMAMALAAAGLVSGSQSFAQHSSSGGLYPSTEFGAASQVAYEYDSYYAGQEEPYEPEAASPSDVPAAAEDQAGGGSCNYGCKTSCCEEEPSKLFDGCFSKCWGLDIGGWVDSGYTWNPDEPADRFNGPMTFNDRSNEYMLDQWVVYMHRDTDTGGNGWDLGGGVDLLYGDDYRFTTALGLETHRDGSRRWNQDRRYYGLAMPQLYTEVAYNDLKVKLGHFYTPVAYETVTATGMFFYSHTFTHQYAEPFTHTGGLGSYQFTDNVLLMAGLVRGWDNWEDTNDNPSFLGGISWTGNDGDTSIIYTIVNGDEAPLGVAEKQNRFYHAVVVTHKLYDNLTWVGHHDLGIHDDAIGTQDAEWYSLTSYLIYGINDRWDAAVRYEWFRDDDGYRVAGLGTNPLTPDLGVTRGGFAGDFQDISLGLHYKPHPNITFRPEVRWDWYDGLSNAAGQRPFDDGSDSSQTTLATDMILTY